MRFIKDNINTIKGFFYNAILEGIVACLLVIGLVWLLTQVAVYNSQKSELITFDSENDELILTPYNAIVVGHLQLSPNDLEYQSGDYSYMYGRELLKERKSRYVSHWADKDATLTWLIEFEKAGNYQVKIVYKANPNKGGAGEFVCQNQSLEFVSHNDEVSHKMIDRIIGEVRIQKAGKYPCSFKVSYLSQQSFVELSKVTIQKKRN